MTAADFEVSPDTSQIKRHLDRLFKRCINEYPGGLMEIRCINVSKTPQVKAQLFQVSSEMEKAVTWALDFNRKGFNIYVGVNPRKPGTERSCAANSKDVEKAFFNFADIDSSESLSALSKYSGTPYTFAVTTGRVPNHRPHIYWELDVPTCNMEAWKDTQRLIAGHFDSDRVIDPPRIMRLAGTINYPSEKKSEERGYITELATIKTDYGQVRKPVSLDILSKTFSFPDINSKPLSTGLNLPKNKPSINIQENMKAIESNDGWYVKTRDLVASLVGRGLSDEEILSLVPSIQIEGYSKEQTAVEILGFIKSARTKYKVPNPPSPETKLADVSRKLPLIYFNDVVAVTDTSDFVEGLLCEAALSVIYGESNCGKTFFATDISYHIAAGKKWRDCEVEQGGVIYAALEGGFGIRNRIASLQKRYEPGQIPLAIIPNSINLLDNEADIQGLIEAISEAAEKISPIPIKMIVIDTLARAMGGGNENSPDDMGSLVINADKIRLATNSHLMFIHHSGKDQARGARGHSSLRAATDTEIEITRDKSSGLSVAKVSKQRDMETQGEFGFSLEAVELGTNSRNKMITSCVVIPTDAPGRKAEKLSGQQYQALKQLRNLMADKGTKTYGSTKIPNVPVVKLDDWKIYLKQAGVTSRDNADTARKQWNRIREALVNKEVIGIWGDFVWVTGT